MRPVSRPMTGRNPRGLRRGSRPFPAGVARRLRAGLRWKAASPARWAQCPGSSQTYSSWPRVTSPLAMCNGRSTPAGTRFGLSGIISTDRAVRRQVGDLRGVSLPTAQLGTVVDVAVVGCHVQRQISVDSCASDLLGRGPVRRVDQLGVDARSWAGNRDRLLCIRKIEEDDGVFVSFETVVRKNAGVRSGLQVEIVPVPAT